MNATRRKKQVQTRLPYFAEGMGEAQISAKRVEADMASDGTESPARTDRLMEEAVSPGNLIEAMRRVKQNRGSPGIDGMTVYELEGYVTENWPDMRRQLLEGTYKPQPVRRMEIPKPSGGTRKLGIPTVLDRLVQQLLLHVLQKRLDPTFSDSSYGFRPGRSAKQAVERAQGYIGEGRHWVVDIDLERFFDQVNHDRLMCLLANRVKDKRVLKTVRAFLNAGVMENGLVSPTDEGTPQGGPLSPLLSNLVLDELDKELERRGHKFVRYADDCNIYVKSERAGKRVMETIVRFLGRKLRLKVNPRKSAVDKVSNRKFLGFSFQAGERVKRRIAPQAMARFKARVHKMTRRASGKNIERMVRELAVYMRGWIGYFGFCETRGVLEKLDSWIRRRLRCVLWKQWKTPKNRYKELVNRTVNNVEAARTAGSSKGPWHMSMNRAMSFALPVSYFDQLGLPRLAAR